MSEFYQQVYDLVAQIPAGRVATYGQIAGLLGHPRRARQVGYALAALSTQQHAVPWHRVINAKGEVSRRADPGCDDLQRILLEEEGVVFDLSGRVALNQFQWEPLAE